MPTGQNADQDQPGEPFDHDPIRRISPLQIGAESQTLRFHLDVSQRLGRKRKKRSPQPSLIRQTLKQIRGAVFTPLTH